jgi:hypothetical protein
MTDKIHKADFYTADSKEEKIMELHKKLNEVIDVINAQNEENGASVATARAEGAAEEREKFHDWKLTESLGKRMAVCQKCGVILGFQSRNDTCRGVVKITLRDEALTTKEIE